MQDLDLNTSTNTKKSNAIDPQVFIVWLAIISSFMMFGAWTSAYIVAKGDSNGLDFSLPTYFQSSTVVILLSSITMHLAYHWAKTNEITRLRWALVATFSLGFAFLGLQIGAFSQLTSQEIYFVGNSLGKYIYLLAGMHATHIIAGIIFLFVTFVAAIRFKVHSKSLRLITMCSIFWHFVDALWIFLYFFMLYNK